MNRSSVVLTGLLALAACQPAARPDAAVAHPGLDSSHTTMDHGAMGDNMPGDASYSDLVFLDGMTAHHQMALDMAELAGERAGSDAVRALGRKIIAAQHAEIDTMRAWRARWFADAPAARPMTAEAMATMGMAGMDMDRLTAARGVEFDRLFQEQMIPHHAGAVTMAAEAQVASSRPEIHGLARRIIAAQAREIGEMQASLDSLPAQSATPTSTDGRWS